MKVKIGQKSYEVEILEIEDGKIKIIVNGKEFIFGEFSQRQDIEKWPAIEKKFSKRNFSRKEIQAPIAGTISEIFIKEGDFVKNGQKILLLSSMKMENEVISDFEGRVKKILVKKNQNVKEGEVLIIII
jgi:biotin carboxyl carrier protein